MQPHVKELRGPAEDAARTALAAEAVRVDEHLGMHYVEAVSVTDWAFGAGQWLMCWIWLIPVEDERYKDAGHRRCGMRVSWRPGNCVTEAWQDGRRVTLQERELPVPETLAGLINMTFGIS
jgi:hypothetical protein